MCAARVQVGPARQSFWAVHMRGAGAGAEPRERTHRLWRRGAVELVPGRIRIQDAGVVLDLALEEGEGIQARCVHRRGEQSEHNVVQAGDLAHGARGLGAGEVWTRKQAGVRAHGTLSLDGDAPREVQAKAVIDDTAGYHLRQTEWWWSAGVGEGADGTALAWNLVQGVNDQAAEAGRHSPLARIPVSTSSERAVWVAGEPSEPAPVRFEPDLSAVIAADGSRLRFTGEARRRRRENFVIVSSDYTAPFGTFAGTLPGGVPLASGFGVMEHHRAKW